MSESREGKIEIKQVQFLVPIRVVYTVDGVEMVAEGNANIATQQVFLDRSQEHPWVAEMVFPFLRNANTLPEDNFEAGEEVYEQADRAQGEYQQAHKQHVGGLDG